MHLIVSGEFVSNKIKLTIHNFNVIPLSKIEHVFNQIETIVVNRGGWFPSIMKITKLTNLYKSAKYDFFEIVRIHDEIDSITIECESKFDTEETNIPDKLYHLTINEYTSKIRKYGLVPKSKSKLSSHLDRIYLCKTYDDCVELIPRMLFYYTGERDDNLYKLGKKLFNKDIQPVIWEIDNSTGIVNKLYVDINYEDKGYYTLSNIPADKIKKLK
jgi:hypothetical protein